MPIDGCQHTFEHLASTRLQDLHARLVQLMDRPVEMSVFAQAKIGPKALVDHFGIDEDPAGLYVLIEAGRPVYVGISRAVIARLRQHVLGRTHFDASLAYRMAAGERKMRGTRSAAMTDPDFQATFVACRERLRRMHATFISVENPVERYLFEAYAAMRLDTAWNTFETH